MEKRYNSAEPPAKVMTRYNSLLWVAKCSHEKRHILSSGIRMINYLYTVAFMVNLKYNFVAVIYYFKSHPNKNLFPERDWRLKAVFPG